MQEACAVTSRLACKLPFALSHLRERESWDTVRVSIVSTPALTLVSIAAL